MTNHDKLIRYVESCPEIIETLNACKDVGLTNYYLAGGAVTQLIWNNLSCDPNLKNVKDFDIVYFDSNETDPFDKELLTKLITHNFELDLVNQALVHTWYHKKYGNKIKPFENVEAGIKSWLSAFAIGIRKTNKLEIYAPFGIDDAFAKKVKPNKSTMSKANYLEMTNSFLKRWNDIEITPW